MENATKALLIAGAVLIAIIMVSIAIYLYSLYSNQAEEYSQIISATELQKFNSKFEAYIGRENITPQEIVSVVNLAEQYNNQVEIYIGLTRLQFTQAYTQEMFIQENIDKLFSCNRSASNPSYDEDVRIEKIIFIKNN